MRSRGDYHVRGVSERDSGGTVPQVALPRRGSADRFNCTKYLRETLESVLAQKSRPRADADKSRRRLLGQGRSGGACERDWAGPGFISSETDKRGSRTQFP